MIDNPEYKGIWAPRKIDNPDYFEDASPANFEPMGAVSHASNFIRSKTANKLSAWHRTLVHAE